MVLEQLWTLTISQEKGSHPVALVKHHEEFYVKNRSTNKWFNNIKEKLETSRIKGFFLPTAMGSVDADTGCPSTPSSLTGV